MKNSCKFMPYTISKLLQDYDSYFPGEYDEGDRYKTKI